MFASTKKQKMIKNFLSYPTAVCVIKMMLLVLITLHSLSLVALLFLNQNPFDFLWGGYIADKSTFIKLEFFALFFSGAMFSIFQYYINTKKEQWKKVLWWFVLLFAIYFSFNIMGNLLARTWTEKIMAIPTFVLAVAFWRIVTEKEASKQRIQL